MVQAQPQPVVQTVYHTNSSGDYGIPALIFAIITTVLIFFFGCWYALLCTGIGIALAIGVSLKSSYIVCVYAAMHYIKFCASISDINLLTTHYNYVTK